MSVSENIKLLKSQIPPNVSLIAVSKTKPNNLILEAYEAGQRNFGENYVQELVDKQAVLPSDINWHFIGHLQSNKVKYLAPFVHLIHGVDSFNLLKEINKQALKNNLIINCLLQIYIAKEESKFGLDEFEAEQIIISKEFNELKNICIVGFMGMATNTDNEKIIEKEFKSLKTFYDYMKSSQGQKHNLKLETLSMGMSSDYQLAINNGSNMIRIGSSIFGSRIYPQ
jgi:pyridoxal phosphate enzyme (YggS family)